MRIRATLAASVLCLSAGVASADIKVTDPQYQSQLTDIELTRRAEEAVELARMLNGPGPSSIRLYADGQPAVFVTAATWEEIATLLAGLPEFKDRFGQVGGIPVTDTTELQGIRALLERQNILMVQAAAKKQ